MLRQAAYACFPDFVTVAGLGPLGVGVRIVDLRVDGTVFLAAEATLTPDELARARRGVPAVHRRRVLLRAALRTAIADEIGVDPAAVPLATTAAGRPYLAGRRAALDVSCSASGDVGVVVVARERRVGVDVQRVEPWRSDVLGEGWLTPAEQHALVDLPADERPVALTRAWTQKEAVLKGRGTGLTGPPREPETVIGQHTGQVAGWQISDLPVPEGWVATLALGPTPDEETS